MKNIKWSKEIFKLVFLIIITVGSFVLGEFVFENRHFSSALLGISAASIGLLVFHLIRNINFIKNPSAYKKEQINLKDERNLMLIRYAKSSSYDLEIFIIFGITIYAIYLNNVGFALAVFILWIVRLSSFFYYLSKNSKEF